MVTRDPRRDNDANVERSLIGRIRPIAGHGPVADGNEECFDQPVWTCGGGNRDDGHVAGCLVGRSSSRTASSGRKTGRTSWGQNTTNRRSGLTTRTTGGHHGPFHARCSDALQATRDTARRRCPPRGQVLENWLSGVQAPRTSRWTITVHRCHQVTRLWCEPVTCFFIHTGDSLCTMAKRGATVRQRSRGRPSGSTKVPNPNNDKGFSSPSWLSTPVDQAVDPAPIGRHRSRWMRRNCCGKRARTR